MIVHFVCTGNSYRSRLAEAYLNSRRVPGVHAVSSGTHADGNENGPISWYAARLIKRHDLIAFMSPHWRQTTAAALAAADLVIFLEDVHRGFCHDALGFTGERVEVWGIPDLDLAALDIADGPYAEDLAGTAATEQTFAAIHARVDALIARLAGMAPVAPPPHG